MRLFVRALDGTTFAADVDRSGRDGGLEQLHAILQARLGIPVEQQVLSTLGGRPLRRHGGALYEQGVRHNDTLELSARLVGGQPIKVKLLTPTPKAASGTEVVIDLDSDTPMHVVKTQLAVATGLDVRHQRVMLAGIGAMVLLDKRSNIGASYCGSTNNLYFATLPASEAPTERKAAAAATGPAGAAP